MSYGINSIGVESFGAPSGAAIAIAGDASAPSGTGISIGSGTGGTAAGLSSYDFRIAVIGDSNASGRGTNDQTAPASGAYLYDSTGVVRVLADPWDSNFGGSATYSALDDGASAGGSFIPSLAQHYADAGKTTLWIPANKGGTQTSNWSRSTLTTTCYGAMKARINAAGGVDKILICLGANDGIGAVSQATFVSRMNTLIADLAGDFPSAQIYLQKIQDFTGYGSQIATIRAGVQEVWEGSSGVLRGADLDGTTTSVHYTTSGELTTVASRTYSALEAVNATASSGVGTGTGSGAGGTASGQAGIDAVASGGSGVGTGSGIGGDASGQMSGAGIAPPATGTSSGSGSGGEATGESSSSASGDGGTGTSTGSGAGGNATGGASASASVPEATGTSTGSGSGGHATGSGPTVRAPSGPGPSILYPDTRRPSSIH